MEDSNVGTKVGLIEGFIGTFISPNKTMKKIVHKPVCVLPILLIAVLSSLSLYMNFGLFFDQSYDMLIKMTPEIDRSAAATGIIIALGGGIVIAAIAVVIVWIILSGFLVLITKNFGGDTNAREMRAITAHSYYITLISVVISAVSIYMSGNVSQALGLNLAVLFPGVTDLMMKTLLGSVDLISFWQYAVIGIGISHVEGMDRSKATTVVVITYILKIIVGVLFVLLTKRG